MDRTSEYILSECVLVVIGKVLWLFWGRSFQRILWMNDFAFIYGTKASQSIREELIECLTLLVAILETVVSH